MKLFSFLAAASEKRPWIVVIVVVAITAFMLGGMSRLTTDMSQEAMMPRGYESIEVFEEVEDDFGGTVYENVLIEADDVTSAGIAKTILNLTPEQLVEDGVMEEGQVLGVESYLDGFKKGLQMRGEDVPPEMFLGPAVDSYLETPYAEEQLYGKSITGDNKAALVKFQLDPNMTENEQIAFVRDFEEYIEAAFEAEGASAYLSGGPSMSKDANEFMMKDTRLLFGIAILFIMLILYLTFRRFSDIFLPLLIIIVAIQWILGFMGWVGIPYTTMSVAILPLMLGINIAYVIHILSRYYEERESGENIYQSATSSIKTVGVAVFLTALTTAIGFASFMITDMPPMRDFGLICVLGIAFSFVLSLTLLPAIVVLRDRRKKSEKLEEHLEKMRERRRDALYGKAVDRSLVGAAVASYHHSWLVVGLLVLLLGFSIFAGFNVKTGADVTSMFPEDMPSRKASEKVSEYFGAQNFDFLLVDGNIYEPDTLESILSMEDTIAADPRNSEITSGEITREGIFSVADLVKNSAGGEVPETKEEVDTIIQKLSLQMDMSGLVANEGGTALVMVNSNISDTEEESKVKSEIIRDAASQTEDSTDLTVRASGVSLMITDLLGNLMPTQLKTSAIALGLCLIVLIIVFKSFFYGLVTLVVVVMGLVAEMIMLYALGWPIDFMTVTISALVIGIGVDFGIHVTHRFREQLHHKGMKVEEAIKTTVLNVGRSLVAAAFTTAGVFAILGISSMVPLRRFGVTVATGLIASLIGAVIVLPSLLAIIAKRRHEAANNDMEEDRLEH